MQESASGKCCAFVRCHLKIRDSYGIVGKLDLLDPLVFCDHEIFTVSGPPDRVEKHDRLFRAQKDLDALKLEEISAHIDLGHAELVAEIRRLQHSNIRDKRSELAVAENWGRVKALGRVTCESTSPETEDDNRIHV